MFQVVAIIVLISYFKALKKMEVLAQNKKEQESKHFTSLQIFTSHAEPALDEYLPRKDQQLLEQKQRDEEDKLYRYLPYNLNKGHS